MPRKAPTNRKAQAGEDEIDAGSDNGSSKSATVRARSADDLANLALKACLIARDAAFNVRDLLTTSSRMAFLAIKDCEKELDLIERQIDERLPAAITRVNEDSRSSAAFQPEVHHRPGTHRGSGDERCFARTGPNH